MASPSDQPYTARPAARHMGGGTGVPSDRPGSGARKRFIDYPRAGRRGFTRWLPSWRQVSSVILLSMAGVGVAFLTVYANTQIPDATRPMAQTTIVYYDDHTELGRFSAENRTIVPLSKVPVYVQNAVLSAEDRTFYTNSGVSITGILRAVLNDARGGNLQGGSTITQQYVKNTFLTQDRTLTRKVSEFFIALKVSRQLKKEEILQDYLNTIYFGRGAWGIEAAAQTYFGKDISQVTVAQGAYLAGIINGPGYYDPADGRAAQQRAVGRWNFVLDGMVTQGWLPSAQRAALTFPVVKPRVAVTMQAGQTGYLLQMVKDEAIAKLGLTGDKDKALRSNGYRIYTTFNKADISMAVKAVTETLPARKSWPSGTQVAIATVDPATGAVKAIYGGADYLKRQNNGAAQDIAVAGSTFKPFTLAAALQGHRDQGSCDPTQTDNALSLKSRFDGKSPMEFPNSDYTAPVHNFGPGKGEQFGTIDLMDATAHSVNTVFVGLNVKIGADQTVDSAVCAGLPANTLGLNAKSSNVLGVSSPHPLDMASAYATFAAQGVRNDRFVISQITQPNQLGQARIVYQHKANPTRVFAQGVMADTTYAMQQVVKRGTGTYARKLNRPVAGKTGTSSSNLSAWFVGFTPQLSTAVAMYRVGPTGSSEQLQAFGDAGGEITGGSLPIEVWTDYMSMLLEGKPVLNLPDPVYGGTADNPAPSASPTPTATVSPTKSPIIRPTLTPTFTFSPTPTGQPTTPTGQPTTPTGPPTPTPTGSPTKTGLGILP